MLSTERRTRRSHDRYEAIKYQLEACLERADLEMMVVGSGEGFLLGHASKDSIDADWVAAILPFMAYSDDPTSLTTRFGSDSEGMMVRAFTLGEHTFYLGVKGKKSGAVFQEIQTATRGVRRILS